MDESGESPSSINQCWYLFLFISVFSIDAHRAPINHWRLCCVILQIDFSPNLSAWMPRWRAGSVECGFPATIGGPDPEIWNDLLAGLFSTNFYLVLPLPTPPTWAEGCSCVQTREPGPPSTFVYFFRGSFFNHKFHNERVKQNQRKLSSNAELFCRSNCCWWVSPPPITLEAAFKWTVCLWVSKG